MSQPIQTHALSSILRQRALEGDNDALRDLLAQYTKNLRSAQNFHILFETIIYFLRPETHRSSLTLHGDSPTSEADRIWLDAAIQCIAALTLALKSIFCPTIPERILVSSMRSYWSTHIVPSMLTIADLYILDDRQPPLRVGKHVTHPRQAFQHFCDFAEITHDPRQTNMFNVIFSDQRYRRLSARLFVVYLERYAYDERYVVPLRSPQVFQMEEFLSELLLHRPLLISAILCFYEHYNRRSSFTDCGVRVLANVLLIHATLFSRLPQLVELVFNRDPTSIKLILRIWHICLTQKTLYPESKGEQLVRVTPEGKMQDCLSSLVAIIFCVCTSGDVAVIKTAIRKYRLLQRVVHLFHYWKHTAITQVSDALDKNLGKVLKVMIGGLRPLLAHYSVLDSAAHALKVMQLENSGTELHAEANPRSSEAVESWNEFCSLVESARPVLEEYKTYVDVLCSNNECYTTDPGNLMKCAGCRYPFYCSQKCQKITWPSHRSTCNPDLYVYFADVRDADFMHFRINCNLADQWANIIDGQDFSKPGEHVVSIDYVTTDQQYQPSIIYGHEAKALCKSLHNSSGVRNEGSLTIKVQFRRASPTLASPAQSELAPGRCQVRITMAEILEHAEAGVRRKGERWFKDTLRTDYS